MSPVVIGRAMERLVGFTWNRASTYKSLEDAILPQLTPFRNLFFLLAKSSMLLSSLVIAAATLVAEVHAHGYVPQIKIGSQYIAGWDITKGMFRYRFEFLIMY